MSNIIGQLSSCSLCMWVLICLPYVTTVYDTTVHVLRDISWMLAYGEECTIPADVMLSFVQHYKAPLVKWIWQTLEQAF